MFLILLLFLSTELELKEYIEKSVPNLLTSLDYDRHFVIETIRKESDTFSVVGKTGSNTINIIIKKDLDEEFEIHWIEEKTNDKWIYSHPTLMMIQKVMNGLSTKISAVEPPELINVVSFRTKIVIPDKDSDDHDDDIDFHQTILKISLFNHFTLFKVEFTVQNNDSLQINTASPLTSDDDDF